MTSLQQKLSTFTNLPSKKRAIVMKWLAKQNEDLQLVAFEKQKDIYFQLSKIEEANKSLLYLAAYQMAADALYRVLSQKNEKNKSCDLNDITDVTAIQAKQLKKEQNSEKWDKLLNLKGKVFQLIEKENLSSREVAQVLKKHHRFEVSHAYIATFYNDMKEK